MRERILKESTRLFLHQGFHSTSIKNITDSVNLTKGAIYWHFKSKNELLETMLDEWERLFLGGLVQTLEATEGGFLARFMRYHKYSTEFAVNHRELCVAFDTIGAEIAGSGIQAEEKTKKIQGRYHEVITKLLEEGKKEHWIDQEMEVSVQADVIIGMHKGVLLMWYMKESEVDGPRMAKTFRTLLLSGILASGKREELARSKGKKAKEKEKG
jgi:AcrR family transcriptional regulator